MVRYVTIKEVLRIHFRVIKSFGGPYGVRDLNLLESALARAKAGFGEYEFYPDIFTKGAVLLYSLIKNHPFIDGNKRTGLIICLLFLKRNGYLLKSNQKDLIDFAVTIASGELSEEQIAEWLKNNTEAIS